MHEAFEGCEFLEVVHIEFYTEFLANKGDERDTGEGVPLGHGLRAGVEYFVRLKFGKDAGKAGLQTRRYIVHGLVQNLLLVVCNLVNYVQQIRSGLRHHVASQFKPQGGSGEIGEFSKKLL